MIGYKIKVNTRTFFVPFKTSPLVTQEENRVRLSVGTYDPETDNVITWIDMDLKESDEISISLEDITTFSKPIKSSNFKEGLDQAKKAFLKEYLELKEELEQEGLI